MRVGWRYVWIGFVLAVCLGGFVYWRQFGAAQPEAGRSFDGSSDSLSQTAILPTLDMPIPSGKSAIWCASFQFAWNRLKSDVVKGPVVIRGAERLNRAEEQETDVPPEMVYATAGFNRDGVWERIQSEMRRRFPNAPLPALDPDPDGATAFAYLAAEVKYRERFPRNPNAFRFTEGNQMVADVHSFGIRSNDREERIREQVQVVYFSEIDAEFALDLCKHSHPNQVVLARVSRGGTLATTLSDLQRKIEMFYSGLVSKNAEFEEKLGDDESLQIPMMHWRIEHRFKELEGKALELGDQTFGPLEIAYQNLDFRLDPEGAGIASSATVFARSASLHRHFTFDRPFLIYLKKRGSERPFFVMWVDNAELLSLR